MELLLGSSLPIGEQGHCSQPSLLDSGKREGHLRALSVELSDDGQIEKAYCR